MLDKEELYEYFKVHSEEEVLADYMNCIQDKDHDYWFSIGESINFLCELKMDPTLGMDKAKEICDEPRVDATDYDCIKAAERILLKLERFPKDGVCIRVIQRTDGGLDIIATNVYEMESNGCGIEYGVTIKSVERIAGIKEDHFTDDQYCIEARFHDIHVNCLKTNPSQPNTIESRNTNDGEREYRQATINEITDYLDRCPENKPIFPFEDEYIVEELKRAKFNYTSLAPLHKAFLYLLPNIMRRVYQKCTVSSFIPKLKKGYAPHDYEIAIKRLEEFLNNDEGKNFLSSATVSEILDLLTDVATQYFNSQRKENNDTSWSRMNPF